jgi:CheY-like chemotaxis protein
MDAEYVDSASRMPATILLADDSTIERQALGHYLRRHGYEVEECEDGRSVISHLQSNEVDLLLLDLQMPNVDGFEVLNYLQKHRRGLPVVLLSGMPVDLIQLKMHGLSHQELPPLFLKPVDLDQLLAVLDLQITGELRNIKSQANSFDQPG